MSILSMPAFELSDAIRHRKVSCKEVMQATLARIVQANAVHNAVVNLRDEQALLNEAQAFDQKLASGEDLGWLHGIPQAIKDLSNAQGLPTVMGSPLMKNFVPSDDGLMTQRMRQAGCIVIGKTNTPEFGLGSHTFNGVFGATRNAFDPSKTAGGSSGGAAVALALNMLSVADGSDFMGSLRNPAGWNNIYGLRPSQGRVPMWPAADTFVAQLGTEGPMGRTVKDVALMLETQAGYDARSPLSIAQRFEWKAATDVAKTHAPRIGWLGDLNGYLPTEAGILDACQVGLKRLTDVGCKIDAIDLGFSPQALWRAWLVWRAALVASRLAPFASVEKNRHLIKPEALWEYDSAKSITASDFIEASAIRSQFYQHLLGLFERYDFLVLPSAQIWPFDIEVRWPEHIAGKSMDTYHRWMEVVIYATFAGLPAISVPSGFSSVTEGRAIPLPNGLQIIGKPQGDLALLQLAAAYEQTAFEQTA
jgi:amidase